MNKQTILVFGSNLSGIHGAGAAREAAQYWGAKWGKGIGLEGHSYAIPTKDKLIETLPLQDIRRYVDGFIDCAKAHLDLEFQVTAVGCGLAGYRVDTIAPLFSKAPANCIMPPRFLPFILGNHEFRAQDLIPRLNEPCDEQRKQQIVITLKQRIADVTDQLKPFELPTFVNQTAARLRHAANLRKLLVTLKSDLVGWQKEM